MSVGVSKSKICQCTCGCVCIHAHAHTHKGKCIHFDILILCMWGVVISILYRCMAVCVLVHLCVFVYIYIYIYIQIPHNTHAPNLVFLRHQIHRPLELVAESYTHTHIYTYHIQCICTYSDVFAPSYLQAPRTCCGVRCN
jgi:hypothetical protein